MPDEFEKLQILVRSMGHCSNPAYRAERSKEALLIIAALEAKYTHPPLSPLDQQARDFDYDFKHGD